MLVARSWDRCSCCTQRLVKCNRMCCGTRKQSTVTKRLKADRHRHEWFNVYVGCCTSGSIGPKGAATRISGVTRTDQWFITAARSSAAGKGAPFSIHNDLLIRDERCVNSELVHDRGWSGRGVENTIAAEALQTTGTARRPLR